MKIIGEMAGKVPGKTCKNVSDYRHFELKSNYLDAKPATGLCQCTRSAREQGRYVQVACFALAHEAVSKVTTFRELATNARIKTKNSLIYSGIRG